MLGQSQGRLGRYELLARLATGGMGEIFLARLEGAAGFEKLYVIKRVLPHLADDARFRAMLIDEARIAAKMSHPNICQVYELGEDHGQLFIAMEYLEGVTLLPILRHASRTKQYLPIGLVAAVLQQTCDALHYAHELTERDGTRLNVVHRDVSPANLFATETGIIKVLDFGIAKAKDASAHTQDGTVKGKYAYMAPEQLRSESADRRADVFSLAIVGFEMLALRRLFQRKTDYLTFRAVMELPIPDLRSFRPDLPSGVSTVFTRALERDPRDRFATARELAAALQEAISGRAKVWSSSEIGDYVRENFAEELRRRGTAVTTVLRDSDAGEAPRGGIPELTMDAEPPPEGDDGSEDFPSIDTGVHVLERMAKLETTPASGGYRIDSGSDPGAAPLTELAPAPSGALGGLRANVKNGTDSVVIQLPPSRRAVLWPLFAVAIVAVGAVALWFMWKQIKSQQSSGGIVIVDHGGARVEGSGAAVIEPGTGSARAAGSGTATGTGTGTGAGTGTAAAGAGDGKPSNKIPTTDSEIKKHVVGRVNGKLGAINDCVRQHKDSVAATPNKLGLLVTANGKAKAKVEPSAVDASPLGACIRGVAESIDYGRLAHDAQLSIVIQPH
jgi:serine/threonine protein kinase